jgi:hypothetical protein
MKKMILKSMGAFAIAVAFSSCSVTNPLTATNNPIGDRVGKSTNNCLFSANTYGAGPGLATSYGLCFNTKNYGIYEAASSADIQKVATVDLKTTNYLFFTKFELIVTGE